MARKTERENFPQLTWDEAAVAATPAIRSALERVLETQDGACLSDAERHAREGGP